MPPETFSHDEYSDYFDYIQDEAVKSAFTWLISKSEDLRDHTLRPKPHGVVNRAVHYYDAQGLSPFAFTVSQHWLLFYIRLPHRTHPTETLDHLATLFPLAKLKPNGEFTFRLKSVADAQRALQYAFGVTSHEPCVNPDEVPANQNFVEGAVKSVRINAYERNPAARKACIKHYGCRCCVCNIDFNAAYGSIGDGYIHVHHIVELSAIGGAYEVDPVRDLRPVCPNCHAMLHSRQPALSIDALKALLTNRSSGRA